MHLGILKAQSMEIVFRSGVKVFANKYKVRYMCIHFTQSA